ncbi:MAG: hypothetical protein V1787_04370 [Candidatus Micrarchaeota archaeon]
MDTTRGKPHYSLQPVLAGFRGDKLKLSALIITAVSHAETELNRRRNLQELRRMLDRGRN